MKPTAVSIRTVAERAGVSIATVSNVLNNRTNVGPELVRRVRSAVDDLGYVADGVASRLRSRRQALAGVIVPELDNPLFASFVSTLEALARQDGFDLVVASCRNDPQQEAERLTAIRSWRPAGCIVIPVDGALAERRPRGGDLPIVAVDRIPDDPAIDLVAVDNAASAEAMTRHLVAEGFTRCLVAGSLLSISNVRERWEGAQAGAAGALSLEMLELGLLPAPIRAGLEQRLAGQDRPQIVFCLDHVTTLVAFEVMGALGLSIPGDVALASFDDSQWMRLVAPGITAIVQPVEAMAQAAWALLARRVSGDRAAPETIRLACRLVRRGSTVRRALQPAAGLLREGGISRRA